MNVSKALVLSALPFASVQDNAVLTEGDKNYESHE
jgi:hypothetical protein